MASPLEGVRVVELADESAAFGGRILADLGAEVIRVEPPDGGRLRHASPFLDGEADPERGFEHLHLNANKRSVVLDRSTASGRARFEALVASADVLVETERLEHAALVARNPRLLHATVTPFGLDGPRSRERGNDLIAVAAGGLATFCGHRDDPPNQPGARQAYKLGGLAVAAGVLFALHGRTRTPGALHLDISLQACVAATTLQSANPNLAAWYGESMKRPNFATAVRCGDGRWMTAVGVRADTIEGFMDWARAEGLDPPPLPEGKVGLEIAAFYAPFTKELISRVPRETALARAQALGMLGTPIQTLPEMETCPQLVHNRQFVDVAHDALGRTLSYPRSAVDAIGGVTIRRPPLLGEDTEAVLAGVGGNGPRRGAEPAPGARVDLADALAGVRVVDFCWVLAGPLGTRLLADFGAEVIRVESGRRGIADRGPPGASAAETGAFHNMVNTAKRSVTIDPRTPEGSELLLELIDTADVVTENYRAGSFAAMGFDYATLRRRNPGLILAHLPGLGSDGPWRDRATYGPHVAAAAGLSFLTGFPHRRPLGIGTAYPDFTSPYVLASVVTAALLRRQRTGEGAELDVGQLSATVSLIGAEWLRYKAHGEPPPQSANRDPDCCPHGVYPARGEDEWIAIAVDGEPAWARCREALALPDDARFASHAARKSNEDALDALVADATRPHEKWALAARLQAAGVMASPVETVFDMLERDPQLGDRFYQRVTREAAPGVEIRVPSEPIREAGRARTLDPAPAPGEDNRYVVCELLGYDARDLERWREAGVIRDYSRL